MRTIFGVAYAVLLLLVGLLVANTATAQPTPAPTAKVQVQPLSPAETPSARATFDPQRATNAYLAQIKGQARKNSDAYFEGGYVLLFVDALYTIMIVALLLWLGVSARMRDIAQRCSRFRYVQTAIYVLMFLVIFTIAQFPLAVYEGFIREHAYGLSNMSFMQWLGDFLKAFAIELVFGTIVLTAIYAAIRRTGRCWWLWGWLITMGFFAIAAVIAPVYLAPMFNNYYPLKDGPVKQEILSLARSNGVPVTNVYEFNASRQSKRVSANVSGFLGTTRISMTDNLLNRSSPQEVYAVLGHEMGHYVLDHNAIGLTWVGLVFLVAFAFVDWGYGWLAVRYGGGWRVHEIADPAGLPVAVALFTFFFLVATPVTNTITRTLEAQADIFGLNTARQPDGFAKATLMLSEYRKLDPTPAEEFVFYDHPSGRSRISMSMRWKAEHLNDPDIKAGPVSPQ